MQLPDDISLNNGKYRIVRTLGQGGYGITYLATAVSEVKGKIGKFSASVPVAIKEFFPKTYCVRDEVTADVLVPTDEGKAQVPMLLKDFVREARSMARLDHPNIVKVIDIFEDHKTAYYVMQYLEGRSLADMVESEGALSPDRARRCIFQIGSAVAYLHEHYICHYDIKPANIMMLESGKAVLIDFGISRHYDEGGSATTIRPVGYSGGYSAPEQRAGDTLAFSPSADIYSLAATLLFMVTGKAPKASQDMSCGNSSIPKEIWNAVRTGMEEDKVRRPASVREWLSMLDDSTMTRSGRGEATESQDMDHPNGGKHRTPVPGNLTQATAVGESPKIRKGDPVEEISSKKKNQKEKDSCASPPKGGSKPRKPGGGILRNVGLAAVVACLILGGLACLLLSDGNGKDPAPLSTKEEKASKVSNMAWERKNRYGNTYSYTGDVIDGIPNGQGRAVYSDGSVYEGYFTDGKRQDGNGKYTDADGNVFIGTFNEDTIVRGRITAGDKSMCFEGTFADDKPFEGSWKDADGKVEYRVRKGELKTVE